MYSLKTEIFDKYFQDFFHREDINLNAVKQGFTRRFVDLLAEELDNTVVSVLNNFLDNTLVPNKALAKFIPYLEIQMGVPVIHEDLAIRRRILCRIAEIWRHKGTLRSYQLLFNALGFDNAEIIPVPREAGFDNSVGFDDESRRFDAGKCQICRYYRLNLNGTAPINREMYDAIRRGLALIDPVYVRLLSITVNNVEVNLIDIFIQDNGDLVYSALSENNVGFTVNPNGDLVVFGEDADKYTLDSNGNIFYNG